MIDPPSLEKMIAEFSSLPGIGRKTARRLAYHLLTRSRGRIKPFCESLKEADEKIKTCSVCHAFTEEDPCPLCASREHAKTLCIVEKSSDILPFENAGIHRGLYHVLGGTLSPLDGVGPEELHIPGLIERIRKLNLQEVILALGSSPEAESTALLIDRLLQDLPVKRTRLARGIPMGSDLEFIDEITMLRAFEGRISL
ncbi:MAG: recombination mediator RecR [Fibrobacter sp.]|jgi:recombination protein RecR|nr:recombination mediator RecR [Fibrobacter sp.]